MSDYMPKGGVKELMKSSDGRRYLEQLQKRQGHDLLQPIDRKTGKPNEMFFKVHGDKLREQEKVHNAQVQDAERRKYEIREAREREQRKSENMKKWH